MNPLLLRAACPFGLPPFNPLPFNPAYFDQLRPTLHDFQADILWRIVAAIQQGYTRILVQLPTGGGKTHMAKALLGGTDDGQFIVHRKELIEQTSKSFWASRIAHGFVASDKPMDLDAAVLLCGIATLAKRLDIVLPAALIILDEAHHAAATTWHNVLNANPDAVVIGLTATPQRLDGKGLGDFFQTMIVGPTTAELIRRGFLSDYDYYAPSLPDMAGVRSDAAAEAIMDRPTLIGDMVEHYWRLAKGEPGIVFAHSVKHSLHLVEAYRGNGVRAAHIDGDMSQKERERIDAAFRAREFDVLSNCSLLGEGYDVPGIVYCGLGRRTQSLSLFRQMVGRDLRVVYADGMPFATDAQRLAAIAAGPKPRGIICDHASNVFQHGMPDDDVEWSLDGRAANARAAGCNDDAGPVHQCLTCYRVTPSTVKTCPGCGTEFPVSERLLREQAGILAKLDREAERARAAEAKAEAKMVAEVEKQIQRRNRKIEERNATTINDLVALALRRGYPSPKGWAKQKMKLRSAGASKS